MDPSQSTGETDGLLKGLDRKIDAFDERHGTKTWPLLHQAVGLWGVSVISFALAEWWWAAIAVTLVYGFLMGLLCGVVLDNDRWWEVIEKQKQD